jgi:hypothetical protein
LDATVAPDELVPRGTIIGRGCVFVGGHVVSDDDEKAHDEEG